MFKISFDKTMDEVKKEVDAQAAIQLVDVREKDEFMEGHLPKARMIPLSDLENAACSLTKDKPLYVYCRSGQRARSAVKRLKAMGFQDVYNIGGIIQWSYEIETGEEHV